MQKRPAQSFTMSRFSKKALSFSFLAFLMLLISDLLIGSLLLSSNHVALSRVRDLDPYYNHGFEKNTEGIEHWGPLESKYYINSLGLKDRQVRNIAPAGKKRRILFLGDSFTEGVGYTFDSTFCGFLQASSDTSQIEILNAAVASFSPKLYYLRLDYLLNYDHLQVNEVYCFLDHTDVSDELVYEDFKPQVPTFLSGLAYAIQKFYRNHSVIYYAYTTWRERSFLKENNLDDRLRSLYWVKTSDHFIAETGHQFMHFRGQWDSDEMIGLPVTQRALGLAQANLINLMHLCRQHHMKLYLVVYPGSEQVYQADNAEQNAQLKKNNARYIKIWKAFAEAQGIDFIDLFPLFVPVGQEEALSNMKKYYIPGDSHWNSDGHRRVADTLSAIVRR